MKKLIFIRHGKAEEPASGVSDFERSLTIRGKIVSRLMAKKLRETDRSSMTLISSTAFRAVETAMIFARELDTETDSIILSNDIYYRMNLRRLPEILSLAGEDCDTVAIFGHNPSFTELADCLTEEGCDFMPKSGVAGIVFDINSWHDIKQRKGKMLYHLKPDKSL